MRFLKDHNVRNKTQKVLQIFGFSLLSLFVLFLGHVLSTQAKLILGNGVQTQAESYLLSHPQLLFTFCVCSVEPDSYCFPLSQSRKVSYRVSLIHQPNYTHSAPLSNSVSGRCTPPQIHLLPGSSWLLLIFVSEKYPVVQEAQTKQNLERRAMLS